MGENGRVAEPWEEARIARWEAHAPGLSTLVLDGRLEPFRAGQFVNLALDLGGERVARSYSLASPPGAPPELLLVRVGRFTQALFDLPVGAGLLLCPRAAGHFTLENVRSAPLLWLLATGTGLAPYLSMLRTEEPWARFERVVLVHAVRERSHLVRQEELQALGRAHGDRLTWVPVVSREDELPPDHLRGRIPALIASGALEARAGAGLDPAGSQVLLCGNPGMIEETRQVLEGRGLRRNRRREPGQITAEAYW